jgi:hypothetical protein
MQNEEATRILKNYRVFLGWNPPAQQVTAALQLIQPTSERREECKAQIIFSLKAVQFAKDFKNNSSRRSPAVIRAQLKEAATILKRAAANDFLVARFDAETLNRLRKAYSRLAVRMHVLPGSRPRDDAKQLAATRAHGLLADFGSSAPSLTQGSTWDQLAMVLFGTPHRSLFSYMRYHHDWPEILRRRILEDDARTAALYRR